MSDIIKPDLDEISYKLFKTDYKYIGLNSCKVLVLEEYVKILQEENEQLKQWKREEIAVWSPLLDYYYEEDKTIKIGESISKEALRRSKEYVRLLEEKKRSLSFLKEAEAWLSFNNHPSKENISDFKNSLRDLLKELEY